MVGLGVGAAALIGGGAYGAVQLLGSEGTQPDSVLPGSAAAYARLDVDPSLGSKVAAVRFFQGLDAEAQARLESGEWREYVWEQLAEEGELPAGLDYQTDVEPWLGDRAGVAVIPQGEDEPLVAVALQVTDGEAATATLDRIRADAADGDQFDHYLDGDYVVLTRAGQADLVRAAAEQGTLDEHDAYAQDMADLGDAGVASVWVDLARAAELEHDALDGMAGLGGPMSGIHGDLTDEQRDLVTGRTAAALRLSPDAIEVHGLTSGQQALALPTGDSAHLVLDLPAGTAAALSLENGADWAQAAWDLASGLDPERVQGLSDQAAERGVTLPVDLQTVLGDSMALAVGPGLVEAVRTADQSETLLPPLPVAYRAETDAAAVQSLITDLGLPPVFVPQRTDDGVITLGVFREYVDAVAAPQGRLADDPTFVEAVVDADEADQLLFVDTNAFEEAYLAEVEDEDARTVLERLAAVGWSTVVTGSDESRFTLRLVADE
jgi:hypothetical protein